jgi:hypothetical protein
MDPELADDAKRMSVTILFAVGGCQIWRWSLSDVAVDRVFAQSKSFGLNSN